jgi:hypothetical protein
MNIFQGLLHRLIWWVEAVVSSCQMPLDLKGSYACVDRGRQELHRWVEEVGPWHQFIDLHCYI